MAETETGAPLSQVVGDVLPYLRRHARALTGSQQEGDRYAAETLEAILRNRAALTGGGQPPKVALFAAFHRLWEESGHAPAVPVVSDRGARAQAMRHLSHLTPRSREALLLHTVEEFTLDECAQIMGLPRDDVGTLVDTARSEMHEAVRGRVLVIEDESIIAMDIESIVRDMGHEVTGVAATRAEAVRLGRADPPDLILADIQLADDSSGIDAVNDLLERFPETPVIFITAFPERLLTGERPEPAFLIAKPFMPPQVISAVSQAMFFASTETLRA
ncbi:MAG: response regulator [Paracoccaceae bacterium]|jgi:DNA-directed RNA polymerase specialized sigma24 family protein|nr:response regulator [Paracoccaceae bacterium]